MNLYLISQNVNNDYGTYSDAVVAAESEERAKMLHPNGYKIWGHNWHEDRFSGHGTWVSCPEYVKVELIGTALEGTKEGMICSSFHAG